MTDPFPSGGTHVDGAGLPPLVVFADDWGRHPSSAQHLVRRLIGRTPILWVNTIGTRSVTSARTPGAGSYVIRRTVEKLRGWTRGLTEPEPGLWSLDAPMLPSVGTPAKRRISAASVSWALRRAFRRLGWDRGPSASPTILTTLPHVAWLCDGVPRSRLIYYCTDDYSHWPSAEQGVLLAAERDLRAAADLVLAVSPELVAKNQGAARVELFPHGVDVAHFASVDHATCTPAIAALPGPRVGFFGLLYEKLDYDLLAAAADAHPDLSFVFVGPVDYCPAAFSSRPNVHLLGAVPYRELPAALCGLDVLTMPYVRDEMILKSNPLKLRECLATGRPTVSVDLPEARRFEPHVTVATSAAQFADAVGEAAHGRGGGSPAARRAAVADGTWDRRAEQLAGFLRLPDAEPAPDGET